MSTSVEFLDSAMASNAQGKTGKGIATKAAILEAARQRFGKDGYALATIRAIARDAKVDPAHVIRYFGDKEALFIATAQFDLRLPDVTGLTQAEVSRVLVQHFLKRWEADDTLMALLRVACTNKGGVDQLHIILRTQLLPLFLRLRADQDNDIAVRAGLVASQMLGLGLCRYILQLPPLAALSHSDVVAWVSPTVERYLFENPVRAEEDPRDKRKHK